jgi:hypothetical protein
MELLEPETALRRQAHCRAESHDTNPSNRHADRLASQGFQGADEILPFASNLKSFGLILFGQQERDHGAI